MEKMNQRHDLQGRLRNGTVAVKRLSKITKQKYHIQPSDFENEVRRMKEARNKNILRFLGYCYVAEKVLVPGGKGWEDADHQMLLCSEYLPNGDLDKYIRGSISPCFMFMFTKLVFCSEEIT